MTARAQLEVHGIIINFSVGGVEYSATYLPHVAREQGAFPCRPRAAPGSRRVQAARAGWTKDQALESLIRKSGFKGSISRALLDGLRVTRYKSSKRVMDYAAYSRTLG